MFIYSVNSYDSLRCSQMWSNVISLLVSYTTILLLTQKVEHLVFCTLFTEIPPFLRSILQDSSNPLICDMRGHKIQALRHNCTSSSFIWSNVIRKAGAGFDCEILLLLVEPNCPVFCCFKGIVHFEIKMWYLSAYPKGIQDVGVFFSSVDPILMFLGQTVLVCQSYNGRYRSLSL